MLLENVKYKARPRTIIKGAAFMRISKKTNKNAIIIIGLLIKMWNHHTMKSQLAKLECIKPRFHIYMIHYKCQWYQRTAL